MDWKYFLAHEWAEDRTAWVDVYLRSAVGAPPTESFCVTVDAVGSGGNSCYSAEENDDAREKLRNAPYHLDGQKMIVRGEDYTKEELLGWVRVWLEASGFPVGQLVEGTHEEFRGTNWHSRMVELAHRRVDEAGSEYSSLEYEQ